MINDKSRRIIVIFISEDKDTNKRAKYKINSFIFNSEREYFRRSQRYGISEKGKGKREKSKNEKGKMRDATWKMQKKEACGEKKARFVGQFAKKHYLCARF